MEMKFNSSMLVLLLVLHCGAILSFAQDFDFFYLLQEWPGSYCERKQSCCYPTTGKPSSDFGIHGLWPNYNNGSYPSNCDPNNSYDESKISDLINNMQQDWPTLACPTDNGSRFWAHEWNKHGTCSLPVLDQHSYFKNALNLKASTNLLQVLQSAGINPDDGFYDLSSIRDAIKSAIGYTPGIGCNADASGNSQLYQIYICADTSGLNIVECPVLPKSKCATSVQFPLF